MATASKPKKADAAGYVDFDEFIEYQLTRTRNGIKSTDLLTALIGGAAVVLGYVLVFALFDHWIIEGGFSTTTRVVLLSLLVLGLVGWAVWKLVLPYFRSVTPLYAARQIEQTQPDLQYSLLTLVDLKRSGRPVPESIEAALEKRSALNLSEMDVEEAVDRHLLMRLSYVLFVLVVLTCAYVLSSPKKLSNSLWRALLPASSVSVATRTQIDDVSPGDVELLARSQLTVTADLSGEVPEEVTLLFTTADRRFVDEPVAMRQTDEGLRRFSGVLTGENGAGILQNLTYRVQAGDAQSDAYVVTVKQPPSATVQEVAYEYPSYMGLDARTQSGGAIDAWEGTWVTVKAKANMPLSSAMILFSDSEDISQKAEEFPAEVTDGVDITARWQLRIRSDGTHPAFYRIQCRNEAGETDIDPTLYPVKIRPDLPPRIELAQPTGDLERPANAIVPLLYAAQDQDFLLRSVVLHMELNGDAIPQQPRLYQAPPFRKSVHDVHNLQLETLNLSPGDRLSYWLEARDNMEPFADRSGNRAVTPKLNITITEPASPEQVQQQLEEDQQQVAEKLEQARQQDDAAPGELQDQQPEMQEDSPPPPPPNDDQPTEPGDQPQPTEAGETDERSTGQGAGGEQQQQGRGEGQSPPDQAADGERGGEQQAGGGERSENGTSNSGQQPDGEESFDDLLKELIQRDQQRQRQPGAEQQPQQQPDQGQPAPSPDGGQQPQEQQPQDGGQQRPGETPQPGQADSPTGDQPPQPGEGAAQQPSTQQPSGPGETPSPSPGQPAGESPESMSDQPSTGRGTDPTPPSEAPGPDAARPAPGEAPGGEATPDPKATPPSEQRPGDAPATAGGQKQPATDPAGARPGDAGADSQTTRPQPDAQQSPDSLSDQPGPQPGEPTEQPDAKSGGQPDGPDEPMQGPGQPDGQRSDRPQTGEGGSAQQTSQGNKGGEQQGPGDSTGQPGGQQPSPQQSGQPGSEQPGAGSQQQPGGQQPGGQQSGGESPDAGGQQGAGEQPGQPPSGADQPSPAGGQQGTKPEMQGDSPAEAPQQGPGDKPSPDEQGGDPQPQDAGGQQESGGQPQGGQQSGEQSQSGGGPSGEGGQAGQQPGGEAGGQGQPGGEGMSQPGGEAGAPPSGGSPSRPGSGTRSDGGEIGPSGPNGQAGGGETPTEGGEGTAGEGAGQAPTADEADLEAKKQAANLVLERLRDQLQRGEIDPELQRDLNLTPERLQEFTQKLEQRLAETSGEDTSPDAQARRRQFEQVLRDIDFDSTGTTREGGDGPREAARGFSGPTREAPPQLREAARLYRERMLRQQRSSQR